MIVETATPSTKETLIVRPDLTSYDSGFEHSLEHLIEVRRMVEQADLEPLIAEAPAMRGILAA